MQGEEPEGGPPGRGTLREPRLLLAATLGLLAAMLVISAQAERSGQVEPTDRIGRRIELSELIAQEQDRTAELEARVEDLSEQVAQYESAAVEGSSELADVQRVVEELAVPAGLSDVRGAGLVVTLEDSVQSYDGEGDPNDLVIHEQDMRAVLNALWAGGAEAISINGSRVLATSAIRCVGTTLYLNGRSYVPPFVIESIGDPADLEAELARDSAVTRFAGAVQEFDLGFEVEASEDLVVPAHSGLSNLEVAQPAGGES